MSGEGGDARPARAGGTAGTKAAEAEQHPCPRCDSTNTKFCYYNNYNLSQPRYFCKACRRYWTQGGTLRNIPVGGGTRRSSAYKRLRTTTSSSSTAASQVQESIPVSMVSDMGRGSGNGLDSGSYSGCEVNLNEALPETGSFSSLLTTRVGGNGFMSWPGYGFGLGVLDWPMEALGEGNGGGVAGGEGNGNGNVSVYNTWQMSGGGGFEGGGLGDGGDGGFGWPDLSISTPAKGGLNFKLEKPHLY